jgi:hypothetical protein
MKFIELAFQNLSLNARALIIVFVMIWFLTNNDELVTT